MGTEMTAERLEEIAGRWDDPGAGGCEGACADDVIDLVAEVRRLRGALRRIAEHPCPNRDCCCGPAPYHDSMGRIARMALDLPEPAEEAGT